MNKQNPIYILAEMASSHEGSSKIAEFIIKKTAESEADGILLQLVDLETYIIPSDEDYAIVKDIYINQKNWSHLIEKANSLNLDVWANVYDLKSFDFVKGKNIKGFKIHSSNLENKELVKRIASLDKEILLSVGGMQEDKTRESLNLIYSVNNKAKLCLMYGLQNFPTNPEGLNLNFIKSLSERFKIPFGYQDHSDPALPVSIYLPVLAVSQGASIIEKHITHNRDVQGYDYQSALNPDEFASFVKDIKIVSGIFNKKADEVSSDELQYREYKTLMKVVAREDIRKGEIFSKDNLAVMRAKKGYIKGQNIELLLNKRAKSDYKKFEPIRKEEIEAKIAIFITARTKSTRLAKKVLLDLNGKTVTERLIERLKFSKLADFIALCTSTNPNDEILTEIARENEIKWFRGSEEDVMERYRGAAEEFGVDFIVSLTADNPLIDPLYIDKTIELYKKNNADFIACKDLPSGTFCYGIKTEALKRVCEIKDEKDTEVWGGYFTQTGLFKIEYLEVEDLESRHPELRMTLDYPEDLKFIKEIYKRLYEPGKCFGVKEIIKVLKENPELININKHCGELYEEHLKKSAPVKLKQNV